jgi:mono/diheme cytochrome c family protein
MTRCLSILLVLICATTLGGRALASDEDNAAQGKGLFLKNKCRSCHSISAENIKRTGTVSKTAKHKPPDLSSVGIDRDHEWIGKFLVRQEKLEGRLHPIRFRGTEDQREALAKWLETLKAPKPEEGGASSVKPAEPTAPAPATPPNAVHDSTEKK